VKKRSTGPGAARLPWAYIEAWLAEHRIDFQAVEQGLPVWPVRYQDGTVGKEPLSVEEIEGMIARDDPVAWAFLNLTERQSFRDDDGNIVIPAGAPWKLLDLQAALTRIDGDLIIECGAEVGKTRDIVLRTLWQVDTKPGNFAVLIASDSDGTIEEQWTELEFQLDQAPWIGGGVIDSSLKPYREKKFASGSSFQIRMCGHEGRQFRGAHADSVLADEVAKWKNPKQFDELWRAGKTGASFRLYSTPDGDYSSPFFAMCDRALRIDLGGKAVGSKRKSSSGSRAENEIPKFRKVNISKRELPWPFWTDRRAESLLDKYGGEQSSGWLTQVEGKWGSPAFSVFPMPTLEPCLRYLPDYRVVRAIIDRETSSVSFAAARLSPAQETVEGTAREEILAREKMAMLTPTELAREIARYFPDARDWADPMLYCGADLGSAQDPSEILFMREIGLVWRDVFRLHLRNADWPFQADVFAHLDHASGHRARYGLDNGSAGSALAQTLTETETYRLCPVCGEGLYFAERLRAFDFGGKVDEIDLATGEPVLDPDRKDKSGNPMPHRIHNKEFSTRVLERKYQGKQIEMANDEGAGDSLLGSAQLMVNHTASGPTERRRFRGEDDHHVDARRQIALRVASERRERWIEASPETVIAIKAPRVRAAMVAEVQSMRDGLGVNFGIGARMKGLGW
jgi:hypothetical protein